MQSSDTARPLQDPTLNLTPFVTRIFGAARFHTEGDVAALRFAPNGTLFSIDETGYLRHWQSDGTPINRFFLSDLETLWAFNHDATLLASANDDLLLWNTATGKLQTRIAQDSWVTAVAFASDSAMLATSHDDGSICLWNSETCEKLLQWTAGPMPMSALSFSPDGNLLASACEDCTVQVWDITNGNATATLKSHTDRIPALAWSADGTRLVSAGWDTSARVWDPTKPEPLMLLNSHSDQVLTLAYSGVGNLLATADSDFDIHLWSNPDAATVAHVLKGHIDEVRALTFSTDGTRLASAGADRVIHVWDTQTGQLVGGTNRPGKHGIALLAATGETLKIFSTGTEQVQGFDTTTGTAQAFPPTPPANCIAASDDGRWLAVGGVDHFTRLFDRQNLSATPRLLEATKPPIGGLSFNPAGTMLAQTSPADGLVWLWDLTTPEPTAQLILIEAADGCTLEAVAFHPNGTQVVVGGIDYLSTGERTGAVCVWNLQTKLKDMVFDIGVYALAVDPKGRLAAGAGLNESVFVWDLQQEEQIFELPGHTDRILAIAFSPDGSYLASGGDDLTLRIWDVLTGRLLMMRELDSPIEAITFSPCGTYLFTGNGNTTCYQIDLKQLLAD